MWDIAKSTFSDSEEEYHKECRNVLSGRENDFEFSVEDDTFEWRKGIWTRGYIKVFPVFEIHVFSDFMQNILNNVGDMQVKYAELQKENEKVKRNLAALHDRLEDMIKIKNLMEAEIYKKCLLIVNTKKERIRELEKELKILKKTEVSLYEMSTDNENSDEEVTKKLSVEVMEKLNEKMKRKSEDEALMTSGLRGRNGARLKNHKNGFLNNNANSPQPSTSKENNYISNEKSFSTPAKCRRKSPTFEESDEDFELKDEGDFIEKLKINSTQLNITDEEPEADLFSQSF